MTARDETGDPGLDPAALAGMLGPRGGPDTETAVLDRIAAHVDAHRGYVAFSGGKDSTACLDLVRRAAPGTPAVHFLSGLDYPETLDYVAATADAWDVPLTVVRAEPDALAVLAATGAWDHHAPVGDAPDLHATLVREPARRAHHLHGPGEVWGLRATESDGRRRLLVPRRGLLERADGTVALAPVWSWTGRDVHAYLARRRVPENPVYARLRALGAPDRSQRVGTMVDGNGLEHGKVAWLRAGWPDEYERIAAVLPRVREWR